MSSPLVPRALLVGFAAFGLFCLYDNFRLLEGQGKLFPKQSWPLQWQMFTVRTRTQARMEFRARYGAEETRLPMEEWLPRRWESGWRWESAHRDKRALDAFLEYACRRSGGDEVSAVRIRWKNRPGRAMQPEVDAETEVLRRRRCP